MTLILTFLLVGLISFKINKIFASTGLIVWLDDRASMSCAASHKEQNMNTEHKHERITYL